MRILVVGSGGREHALAWSLGKEAEVTVCPGNGLSQTQFSTLNCSLDDDASMAGGQFDLVVVGPEDPLVKGLADRLRARGVVVFGPGAAGAQLEGSKAFSKELMTRAGVRTAQYQVFSSFEPALFFGLKRLSEVGGVAVKASGNALGKGVILCVTEEELQDALEAMLIERTLGDAADEVVIEDLLRGYEFSLMTLVGDHNFVSLPVARDYKRALDGDRGPNTGGMGTYSTPGWPETGLVDRVEAELVAPIVQQLKAEGIEYRGALFTGVLVQDDVPYCLEYNVRFGDPETQSFVRRLGPGFARALLAAASGEVIPQVPDIDQSVVSVVLASAGYPGSYGKGQRITLGEFGDGVEVFGAGVSMHEGQLVTSGGRVLAVSAVGASLMEARTRAYEAANQVHFEGRMMRTDIGRA